VAHVGHASVRAPRQAAVLAVAGAVVGLAGFHEGNTATGASVVVAMPAGHMWDD